ncbi:hemerythrin domain-containing protein [Amycolatopsis rhizosphaerae]|uniref:Hemerythrin domain-containing protein n=1 Tax=Amycolatopsis rhizosphaerae TaxID=2053003 RepID=A0A557ZZ89_9PSEU|nr:hemerythrin domain-containing protein [Amycolatopsis rhizosphaerae]TVT17322.1 hemerythrin domain-containing protein [Amycolatopsis rhizosphaerae]
MCEYCGCQSITAIAELTAEHDHVAGLISLVREARARGDAAGMARLAREIATVLGPHTQVEEQGLFPALEGDFGEHVASLTAEHRRIEAVLDEAAAGTPADPAWPDRLMAVLHVLREHILTEQDGVFPAALGFLGTEDWAAVDAVRERVGSSLPTAFPVSGRTGA